MSAKTIVLAHGLLGIGTLAKLPAVVSYFNGVGHHWRAQGHRILEPSVNPVGSIVLRGEQLARLIRAEIPEHEPVHIVAHSMGGLDARHAIRLLGGRVRTLVTIGTPHSGSPVADALHRHVGPLVGKIPPLVMPFLRMQLGAVADLTTSACAEFNASHPDVPGVRYIEVTGDASKEEHQLPLFEFARLIGGITGEINDGVVTRSSALRPGHEHLPDWPVDHFGEIGWGGPIPKPVLPGGAKPPHLSRYDDILARL